MAQVVFHLPALTVKNGDVVIRRIRFVVDATESDILMAAFQWQGGHVRFEECEFIQVQPPKIGSGRVASIELAAPRYPPRPTSRSQVLLCGRPGRRHLDRGGPGGQNAVVWTSPAWVKMDNCAFGPHAAVRFSEGDRRNDFRLELHNARRSWAASPRRSARQTAACRLDVDRN